jgi:hypothetical protein
MYYFVPKTYHFNSGTLMEGNPICSENPYIYDTPLEQKAKYFECAEKNTFNSCQDFKEGKCKLKELPTEMQ